MSSSFLEALHSGKVLLMDGAMGTELIRAGVTGRMAGELANISQPSIVAGIHAAYVKAGAVCLLTNTFQAHMQAAYSSHMRDTEWTVVNLRGLQLARGAEGPDRFVLGDIGPPLEWWRTEREQGNHLHRASQISVDHIRWLSSADLADAILLETQPAIETVAEILQDTSHSTLGLPCIVSFTFNNAHGRPECNGLQPEAVASFVDAHEDCFDALGVNCGRNIDLNDMIEIVQRYRAVTRLPILARPNAGNPQRQGDYWTYPVTPAQMAARLPELIDAGATLIGGCCGTTPEHIAACREVIDRLGVGWKPK